MRSSTCSGGVSESASHSSCARVAVASIAATKRSISSATSS